MIAETIETIAETTNTEINPETGVLSVDDLLGQDPAERPDAPVEQAGPKAPLAEAESLLAWLKTQPSTPENKAHRAQAGIVVDYLKAE